MMITKDKENVALLKEFEEREAGVMDLLEFYANIEAVYTTCIQVLEEGHTTMVSNSTNRGGQGSCPLGDKS